MGSESPGHLIKIAVSSRRSKEDSEPEKTPQVPSDKEISSSNGENEREEQNSERGEQAQFDTFISSLVKSQKDSDKSPIQKQEENDELSQTFMFEEMSIADEYVASGAPPHKSAGVIDLDAFNKGECFNAPASVPSVPSLHYKNKLVNE
jgi:hypothetical protein